MIACLFLIDTNFIISHLSIVKGLVNSHDRSKALVLIPWVVIQELDGLKGASASYGQANLAQLARNAIKFIYDTLASGASGLRGQKMSETIDATETGDDAILDCARYWSERQDVRVVLLSNDKNLCSKFMIHGTQAISHELGLSADAICKRVLSDWAASPVRESGKFADDGGATTLSIAVEDDDSMMLDDVPSLQASQSSARPEIEPQVRTNTSPPASNTIEMETDALIPPLVNPRQSADPFLQLAAKAGESRYSRYSRPLQVRGISPETARRRSVTSSAEEDHRARSYSPEEMIDISVSTISRSRPISPSESVPSVIRRSRRFSNESYHHDLLTEVQSGIESNLPELIKYHLLNELKDQAAVDFLVPDNLSFYSLLMLLDEHWMVCFSRTHSSTLIRQTPRQKQDSLKTYIKSLSNIMTSRKKNDNKNAWAIRELIGIWKDLSSYKDAQYKAIRDATVNRWTRYLPPAPPSNYSI